MNPKIKSLLFLTAFVASAIYYDHMEKDMKTDKTTINNEGYILESKK